MFRKSFSVELKDFSEAGEFEAVFSTLNAIDHDGDVTLPGAFDDGAAVNIAEYGHDWSSWPIGDGHIETRGNEAVVRGVLYLDTPQGEKAYRTMKARAQRGVIAQEFSYGFDILESESGEYEGKQVRFLKRLQVFEVSPVLLGAGVNTRLEMIKQAAEPLTDEQIIDALRGDSTRIEAVMKALAPEREPAREPATGPVPPAAVSVGEAIAQLRLAQYAAVSTGGR